MVVTNWPDGCDQTGPGRVLLQIEKTVLWLAGFALVVFFLQVIHAYIKTSHV